MKLFSLIMSRICIRDYHLLFEFAANKIVYKLSHYITAHAVWSNSYEYSVMLDIKTFLKDGAINVTKFNMVLQLGI